MAGRVDADGLSVLARFPWTGRNFIPWLYGSNGKLKQRKSCCETGNSRPARSEGSTWPTASIFDAPAQEVADRSHAKVGGDPSLYDPWLVLIGENQIERREKNLSDRGRCS